MAWFKPTGVLGRVFAVGIILKGIDGIIETASGALLLIVSAQTLRRWAEWITQGELSDDPHDAIAHALHTMGAHFGTVQSFAAMYLIGHGLVKILLVGALLRDKLWAYPILITVLVAFIGYQCYRFSHTHSLGLVGLTMFDAVIVVLTWLEYGRRRHSAARI